MSWQPEFINEILYLPQRKQIVTIKKIDQQRCLMSQKENYIMLKLSNLNENLNGLTFL